MVNRTICWDSVALKQFAVAIGYIAKDSIQNAEKVQSEILKKIAEIPLNPEMFMADKYRINNNGLYRAFELHRLRITYYIASEKIRILRVRHTSRVPKTY
jgi:plasmid stabilization system protein ParE